MSDRYTKYEKSIIAKAKKSKEKELCYYCKDGHFCSEILSGYTCTRKEGHRGYHVACGYSGGHALRIWKD